MFKSLGNAVVLLVIVMGFFVVVLFLEVGLVTEMSPFFSRVAQMVILPLM